MQRCLLHSSTVEQLIPPHTTRMQDTSTVWGGVHLPTKVSVAIKIEVKSDEADMGHATESSEFKIARRAQDVKNIEELP